MYVADMMRFRVELPAALASPEAALAELALYEVAPVEAPVLVGVGADERGAVFVYEVLAEVADEEARADFGEWTV